jgi:hypothetical protein
MQDYLAGETRRMNRLTGKIKVRKMSGQVPLPGRVALRKKPIWVHATLPEIRARLPHEYRNTFTYRNPERIGRCDLCNKKRKNSRHTF